MIRKPIEKTTIRLDYYFTGKQPDDKALKELTDKLSGWKTSIDKGQRTV